MSRDDPASLEYNLERIGDTLDRIEGLGQRAVEIMGWDLAAYRWCRENRVMISFGEKTVAVTVGGIGSLKIEEDGSCSEIGWKRGNATGGFVVVGGSLADAVAKAKQAAEKVKAEAPPPKG